MLLCRQEYLNGLLFPSLFDSGIKLRSPALQADSLQSEPLGKQFQSIQPSNYLINSPYLGINCPVKAANSCSPSSWPCSPQVVGWSPSLCFSPPWSLHSLPFSAGHIVVRGVAKSWTLNNNNNKLGFANQLLN